ncbi:MAG: ABC transporter permease [Bacteroidetes bacterium]|nr:ABC transporter permease [Bacteroidota bacterium]
MATKNAFSIELAIADWRKKYSKQADIWPVELDELESHIRELFESYVESGLSETVAFERATESLGSPQELAIMYRDNRFSDTVLGQTARFSDRFFPALFQNYFRSAVRSMRRSGIYTFIATFGLAIALACCAWILVYAGHELNYDRFHVQSDNIVRLVKGTSVNTPERWLAPIEGSVAGVQDGVRIMNGAFDQTVFKYGEMVSIESRGIFADNSIFDVFSWKLALGSPETALARPYTIVLTRELITKLGLPANPIGTQLDIAGISNSAERRTYEITGVLESSPGLSHITFDYILSLETVIVLDNLGEWGTPFSWTNRTLKTYLLLEPGSDRMAVRDQIGTVLRSFIPDTRYALDDLELQELGSIHLESTKRGDFQGGGSLRYVYLLSGLAGIVLILAIVNFVNLAVARAFFRSKEIGMRKAIGASKGQIRTQYLIEAGALTLASLMGGLVLAYLIKDFVFQITQTNLTLLSLLKPNYAFGMVGIALLTSLASGFYPALILSRYEPVDALKPGSSSRFKMSWIRKGLIVFQLAASFGLVATTLIMQAQMSFVANRPLGYATENVLVVQFGHSTRISDNIQSILQRLRNDTRVVDASASHSLPSSFLNGFSYLPEGAGPDETVSLGNLALDSHLMNVLEIEVLVGRTFRPDDPADSLAFVLNESGARALGWEPDNSILGRNIVWEMGDRGFTAPVIGVVKDFHYGSLHNAISPIVFNLSRFGSSNLIVKVLPEHSAAVLEQLESDWKQYESDFPFAFSWMDDRLENQYSNEHRLGNIFTYSAILALLLAGFGLFSVTSFTTKSRTKEIGIRKTLGAHTHNIFLSFTFEFGLLILLGLILAVPLTILSIQEWLNSFAYRIDLGLGPFVWSTVIVLSVALLSIAYQTYRAASANPTISLRSE